VSQHCPMIEIWRGPHLESWHTGHAVVCGPNGAIIEAWGDPDALIYPRSSAKMIQALPLLLSGAGSALTDRYLALACASHQGGAAHVDLATQWLSDLGLGDGDLRCGPQWPADLQERDRLVKSDDTPCQIHNNCSGKHAGFLMMTQHLRAGPEYVDPDHPLQLMIKDVFEDVTGMASPGFGIDGCSAPNYLTSVSAFARALAMFANAQDGTAMGDAMVRLRTAMYTHPDLVAGETRACTELMRACPGVALKTGAEAVFAAILPEQGLGIAVKITDGSTRAAEAAITSLLTRYAGLDAAHSAAQARLGPIRNWRGIQTGETRISAQFA